MKTLILSIITVLCAILISFSAFGQIIEVSAGVSLGETESNGSYVWSHDGKWIVTQDTAKLSLISADDGSLIATYNASSQYINNIYYTFNNTKKSCFTPDCKEIYVTYTSPNITPSIPVLMAINVESKSIEVLREKAGMGHFSRDGRLFCYINYDPAIVTDPSLADDDFTLAVENRETGETSFHAINVGTDVIDFSIGADNSYVVASIVIDEHGYRKLYKISFDGSDPEQLIPDDSPWNLAIYESPDCSPDGKWVMFAGWTNTPRRMYVFNLETKELKSVFPDTDIQIRCNSWSPDGTKFCCHLRLPASNYMELFSFDFIPDNL